MKWIDEISMGVIVLACLFLGLALFVPESHVWQKIKMLGSGALVKPIDIFDLVLHGSPWVLLGVKLWREHSLKHE